MIEEQMRYLAGFGVHAQEDVAQSPSTVRFLHGDLTRSTMMTTDTSALPVARVAYTAFGDPVAWDAQSETWRVGWPVDMGTRYQYDGGWGYESGLVSLFGEDETLPPVTLQHVGWRWYQPSLGRFVQRDPIGLEGGLNVYAYTHAEPVAKVDPSGSVAKIAVGIGVAVATFIFYEVYAHHVGEVAAKQAAINNIKNAVRQDISTNDPKPYEAQCVDLGPRYPYAKYQRVGDGQIVIVVVDRNGERTLIRTGE